MYVCIYVVGARSDRVGFVAPRKSLELDSADDADGFPAGTSTEAFTEVSNSPLARATRFSGYWPLYRVTFLENLCRSKAPTELDLPTIDSV